MCNCTYWADPPKLEGLGLNHTSIATAKNVFDQLHANSAIATTEVPTSFDLSKGPNIVFYREQVAKAKPTQAFILYGLVGTAFIFYEEIAKAISHHTASEAIVDESSGIERRTFLKLAASVVLSLKIQSIQRKFSIKNKDLLTEIQNNTYQTLREMDIGDEVNFARYFGQTPLEIYSTMLNYEKIITNVLNSGYSKSYDSDWVNIHNNLKTTLESLKQGISIFEEIFQFQSNNTYQIPAEMTEMLKYLWATQKMQDFVAGKKASINFRHFIDAGILALGLGLIATLTEVAVIPASDYFLGVH